LKQLRDEGYDIEVRPGFLLVKHVPYLTSAKEIKYGILVSELTEAGGMTDRPKTHIVQFAGGEPCDERGSPIPQIKHQATRCQLDKDLWVDRSFSNKPPEGYANFYDKMTTYVRILMSPAQVIDPTVTATTFPVVPCAEAESVFNYYDTASSRAGISAITRKLELGKVAIVGLGGTGSYVLDLIAKTPVKEIHLFDGDAFLNHNAFRSPGAASIEELETKPSKVAYFREQYSKMRRGIIAHECYMDASNADDLKGADFVFLCLDKGAAKRVLLERMLEWNIPFIDVGMGVEAIDNALLANVRTTAADINNRNHIWDRIPLVDGDANDEYSKNIQIADLNALNAALAVIKWKKFFGFYVDLEHEYQSVYVSSGNCLLNEEQR
jgi:molybdopterin/thiamine biosynthesis adenylyltransferase